MFSNLFGKKQPIQQQQTYTRMEMLNNSTQIYSPFGGNVYASDLVRACIHAISTHVAKTKAKHVSKSPNLKVEYMLTVRPNQYMSAFDMIYKTITQLYINNNAYILIQRGSDGNIVGFYPLNYGNTEFLEYMGQIYVKFTFLGGQAVTVPYNDVIHLRRHFNSNDMYGDSNSPVLNTLEILNTTDQGITNAVKSSANLKGILKITGANLNPDDLKKKKDEFVTDYLNINNGGVAATDSRMDYTPLSNDPKIIDDKQMSVIEEKVFKYYNINKKIIMNDFDENIWNAFWEGVIEPICIQLGSELTAKCFTDRERGFGNQIIFTANRLNYMSNQTKVSMCKDLIPMGIFSVNEARELFGMESIEDDRRIVSLNYVDYNKQNEYQVGEVKKKNEGI